MVRVVIHGGRLDGAEFSRSRAPQPRVWIDARRRCWARPGRDRELHALVRVVRATALVVDREFHYENLHYGTVTCAGCGWLTPRTGGECVLCGVVLS